jgi:hypothetical protein
LQQLGAHQVIVVWATREAGAAKVEFRTGSGAWQSVSGTSTLRTSSATGVANYYQHEVTLTGLTAATTYQYDLRSGSADPTPGVVDQFRTAPTDGSGTIRLVAFGDSGNGSSGQSQIASRIGAEVFDLAIHTGDIAYSNGTYLDFDVRFFPYYRDWLRRVGFFPSIGNHDDRTSSATPYRTLFVLPRDGGSIAYPNNAERFYSFDFGPVHFICLDTEEAFLNSARRKEQIAWLTADLQASQSQPWRIAFFHRPSHSSGTEHGSDLAIRQAFSSLFERYNVQLVLNGHEHSLERSVPWRESANADYQPVTYIVTGGGGATGYPVGHSAFTAYSRSILNYIRMTISPASLTLEGVGTNGAVLDRFTLDRDLQLSDATAPQVAFTNPASDSVLTGVASVQVTADDDTRVEKVDLWMDGELQAIDLTAPYSFSMDTRSMSNGAHTLQARAYDLGGRRTSVSRNITVSNGVAVGDIVLWASEAPVRTGSWRVVTDPTAAGGSRLEHPEAGAPTIEPPLANPTHYVEVTATVEPDVAYRIWMRMKAASNNGYSDSVWVQTSDTVTDSGTPTFRIGTTSATRVNLQDCAGCTVSSWGWQDNGYGTGVLGDVLRFATGGAQTIRIQAREDGVSIDQVVLSRATYLTKAPGAVKNDTTILPKQ